MDALPENQIEFEDKTPVTLTRADLNKVAWRTMLLNTSFNYERMQAGGVLFALLPALKKIHANNPEDLKKSLKLHNEFFNTNTFVAPGPLALGLAAESRKEPLATINAVKLAAMAPLAGIGDSLLWATGIPIIGGIAASLASTGNAIAPFFYILAFFLLQNLVRFGLMRVGYRQGIQAITSLKDSTRMITRAATLLGLTVIGGLIAAYVSITTPLVIHAGDAVVTVQKDLLDAISPKLLPLLVTGLLFWLIKYKGAKPLTLISLIAAISLVFSWAGIL
ncbi:PTS system mannose/fructose/sorbose family transporter subunit IID [Atlantibacter subterraneus]|uniref:PTS system mannose/fructose/sorbose family transporter subunit IID n=1 Tax=Atlantibacter subterraneus TaxID=255519 RepID=UPI0028B048AB|nr:PTS system mannose/fructose/sorbose family transporter subunit IID [Atlantibacter subterranea]